MKKIRFLLFLIFPLFFVIFLQSCSGRNYQDYKIKTCEEDINQKAVVVLKVRGKKGFLSLGVSPKVSFDLAKIDPSTLRAPENGTYYHIQPGFFGNLNPLSKWEIILIEPGFYVIDKIIWKSGNTTYYTKIDPSPSACPVKYGAFKVKAGTVNYLGDLEFSRGSNRKLSIKHEDHFSEAKEELRKLHPNLADRLTPIEFFPEGYCYR